MVQAELVLHPIQPTPGSDEDKVLSLIRQWPEGITTGEMIPRLGCADYRSAISRLRRLHGWPIKTIGIKGQRQKLYRLEA